MPYVSIIIPIFNAEAHLKQCLDSVISQTLQDIEIICVDDGSTDGSASILSEYSRMDSRMILLSQLNSGAGAARNLALQTATGEFVTFLDSDDYYWDISSLEQLYTAAVKNNVLVCSGLRKALTVGGAISNHPLYRKIFETHSSGTKLDYLDYQHDYHYQNYLFSRKMLIENNICFPLFRRYQDPPFFVRAMFHARYYYVVPVEFYCYREGTPPWESMSPQKLYDMLQGLCNVLRFSAGHGLSLLHWITVQRINHEFCQSFVLNINPDNYKMLDLLVSANRLVVPRFLDIVQESGIPVERLSGVIWDFDPMVKEKDGSYLLRPLRELTQYYATKETLLALQKESNAQYQALQKSYTGLQKSYASSQKDLNKLRSEYIDLNSSCAQLNTQYNLLQRELHLTRMSWSYRLGRALTWIPRILRDGK